MNRQWLDWTALNLKRGCDPQEVREILRSNGFAASEIEFAISRANGECSAGGEGGEHQDAQRRSRAQLKPDYAKMARPNLLKNPCLRQIDAEGIQLYVLDNFMSDAECSAVIDVMERNLRPSTVTSGDADRTFRTSPTCDLGEQCAEIVEKIDRRIARVLGIRREWSEVIQAQKYEVGQEFKAHTDYFEPDSQEFERFAGVLGQRTWTFMVYLNETERGGATHFCAIDRRFEPRTGRALIWNNLKEDGSPNPRTLHQGTKVEAGCKMIITKWFRDKGRGNPFYARH
jgi:prolyl 4-hydroxylase